MRYNDPFLPVERAARSLERTFQTLLDAQSVGLSAGVGTAEADDISSVGSPTPTPSVSPTPRRSSGPKTIPIRQPKTKMITLRGARRGLAKSMAEYTALKEHEMTLIDREVVARDNALKQASDLGNRRRLLEDEIHKIKAQEEAVDLRAEVHNIEQEIQQLETTLLELKSRHRQLSNQLREIESSKDSELSSYTESLALNENQVKSFLRRPPILQSLGGATDGGMYALKAERRTLQMAQEQWTSEVEMLNLRKSDVENEKLALQEGSRMWTEVVSRIRVFERDLKEQTKELAQSQIHPIGDHETATKAEDVSAHLVLTKLSALIASLEKDLEEAEMKNWNLLICAIGAELAAFEQARDLLQETAGSQMENGAGHSNVRPNEQRLVDDADGEAQDAPHEDLLSGGTGGEAEGPSGLLGITTRETNGAIKRLGSGSGERSPSDSSNHSLEDTLREFGNGFNKGKGKEREREREQGLDNGDALAQPRASGPGLDTSNDGFGFGPRDGSGPGSGVGVGVGIGIGSGPASKKPPAPMSESEDDDPGPDFLLSHS